MNVTSEKKYSSVTTKDRTYIKGAYEKLLAKSNKYINKFGYERIILNKDKLIDKLNLLSNKGIRIVMLGIKKNTEIILQGFALIRDEPRENVKEALELVSKAGIHTIMITGDSKVTASAIARELNILKNGEYVLTSDELNNLTDEEIEKILPKLKVVARSLPSDKMQVFKLINIVSFWS